MARGRSRARSHPGDRGRRLDATAHAIALTKDAEAGGADAVLSVVPYYNKPGRPGYTRISAPSRKRPDCRYPLRRAVAHRLRARRRDRGAARGSPRIIGLKDATGDLARPARLRGLVGAEFRLLSGDDATALGFFGQGGDGCISVTSNVAPGLCRSMFLAHGRASARRPSAGRDRRRLDLRIVSRDESVAGEIRAEPAGRCRRPCPAAG